MVKDNARFKAVGGWGYGAFRYEDASGAFTPATTEDHPPQASDAKCGVACHTKAKARDFVFTEYANRYGTQMTIGEGPTIVKQLAAGCDQWIMLYQNWAI